MDTGVIAGWDLPNIHAMGMEATQAAFLHTVLFVVLVVVTNEAKVAGLQKEMLLLCNKQRSSWLLWRVWYMFGCHPGAAATHKRRAHTSRCLPCHTCIYARPVFVLSAHYGKCSVSSSSFGAKGNVTQMDVISPNGLQPAAQWPHTASSQKIDVIIALIFVLSSFHTDKK